MRYDTISALSEGARHLGSFISI